MPGPRAGAGRVRTVRFGPRTLDVDVLLVGDVVVDEDDLVVPHPRMWERRFVVEPAGRPGPRPGPAGRWLALVERSPAWVH